ncbi:Hypothetical predicted protein [Marmota monax]|uniref:Uncharacterized protein n=1 Tax=Marmota monax TaxID=9995 RepID=A0A5E4B5U3_MARMO|nr:hypothetical protein GHT09_004759 [Marmota monax]VTJ64984.1 Hypothetical predicted protein [Marmota monax]
MSAEENFNNDNRNPQENLPVQKRRGNVRRRQRNQQGTFLESKDASAEMNTLIVWLENGWKITPREIGDNAGEKREERDEKKISQHRSQHPTKGVQGDNVERKELPKKEDPQMSPPRGTTPQNEQAGSTGHSEEGERAPTHS